MKIKRVFASVGVRERHTTALKILGKVGFIAKGIVYGLIGGMTCATALRVRQSVNINDDASPQSAFILLGGINSVGPVLLVILSIGLAFYSTWRLWEGLTGQGTTKEFSRMKNIFKYRVSPIISGFVYIAYLIYIIKVFRFIESIKKEEKNSGLNPGCIPNCWNKYTAGKIGTSLLGIAFLIACITQLIPAFLGTFYHELKTHKYSKITRYSVHALGHIGFIGRAGVFLLVSIFMFKSLKMNTDTEKNTVGAAIDQLLQNKATKGIMFVLGLFLIIFGLFAALNSVVKYFPTRPPKSDTNSPTSENQNQSLQNISRDISGSQSPFENIKGASNI